MAQTQWPKNKKSGSIKEKMPKNSTNYAIVLLAGFALGAIFTGFLFFYFGSTQNTPQSLVVQGYLEPLPVESYSSRIDIVAVSTRGQEGITNTAEVEIRPGKGRVLFALNPFTEPDTQQSAEIAAQVAQRETNKDLSDFDLIYSINSDYPLVGGPSAGAALAVATIAAIEKKTINSEVAMTGTILPDGSIGEIGGVIEKATAAAKAGKKIFLVPRGQTRFVYYEPRETVERRGFFEIRRVEYVPKELDLKQYAKEQLNLEVKEVSNIREAVAYFTE